MTARIALVTGGNRGLGFETCRQLASSGLRVVLTARDDDKAREAARILAAEGHDVHPWRLDVTRIDRIDGVVEAITEAHGRIDVLVNNAGIVPDPPARTSVFDARIYTVREGLETNAFGPLRLCQVIVPAMVLRGYGRVVNVSTGMAGLTEMGGGHAAYRISKVALNAVTRIVAAEVHVPDVKINSVCPGWVRTDMSGPHATRSVDDGARGIVWAATLPPDGPTGGFFRDGQPLPW